MRASSTRGPHSYGPHIMRLNAHPYKCGHNPLRACYTWALVGAPSRFYTENIIFLFYKTSFHNEEVNCTEPFPSVSIPCLDIKLLLMCRLLINCELLVSLAQFSFNRIWEKMQGQQHFWQMLIILIFLFENVRTDVADNINQGPTL